MLVPLTRAIAESGSVRLLQPMSRPTSRQPQRRMNRISWMLGTLAPGKESIQGHIDLQTIERRVRSVGALSKLVEDDQVSSLRNGARAAVTENRTNNSGMGGAEAEFRS